MVKSSKLHKHAEFPEPDCAVFSFLCVYFCLASLAGLHTHSYLLQISLIVSLVNIDYVAFQKVWITTCLSILLI